LFCREYLLGFSKRKKERKQRALDALKKKHLEEAKEIKQKVHDGVLAMKSMSEYRLIYMSVSFFAEERRIVREFKKTTRRIW